MAGVEGGGSPAGASAVAGPMGGGMEKGPSIAGGSVLAGPALGRGAEGTSLTQASKATADFGLDGGSLTTRTFVSEPKVVLSNDRAQITGGLQIEFSGKEVLDLPKLDALKHPFSDTAKPEISLDSLKDESENFVLFQRKDDFSSEAKLEVQNEAIAPQGEISKQETANSSNVFKEGSADEKVQPKNDREPPIKEEEKPAFTGFGNLFAPNEKEILAQAEKLKELGKIEQEDDKTEVYEQAEKEELEAKIPQHVEQLIDMVLPATEKAQTQRIKIKEAQTDLAQAAKVQLLIKNAVLDKEKQKELLAHLEAVSVEKGIGKKEKQLQRLEGESESEVIEPEREKEKDSLETESFFVVDSQTNQEREERALKAVNDVSLAGEPVVKGEELAKAMPKEPAKHLISKLVRNGFKKDGSYPKLVKLLRDTKGFLKKDAPKVIIEAIARARAVASERIKTSEIASKEEVTTVLYG